MRDLISVIRYWPEKLEQTLVRALDPHGRVRLQPTVMTRHALQFRPQMHGRRWRVNSKARKDRDAKRTEPDGDRPATKKKGQTDQRAALKPITEDKVHLEHGRLSIFGDAMKDYRVTGEECESKFNAKATSISKKHPQWLQPRINQAKVPPDKRFGETVKEKTARPYKAAILMTFRAQVKAWTRRAVLDEDIACTIDASCRSLKPEDLPQPFVMAASAWTARLLVTKSLPGNLKGHTGALPNGTLIACLMGQRVCTPKYIAAVGKALAQ